LFSAQDGSANVLAAEQAQRLDATQAPSAGTADAQGTVVDEGRNLYGDAGAAQRFARLFGGRSPAAESSTTADRPASSQATSASWQDLLIGPAHESVEVVAETTTIAVDAAGERPAQDEAPTATETPTDQPAKAPEYATNGDANPSAADAATDTRAASDREDVGSRESPSVVLAELVLVNPPDSAGTIRYLVNGHSFSMPPGHSQHLPAGREWRVHFHRGGSLDDVEMVLRSGTYEFRASEAGWQLWATDVDAANR